MSTAKSLFILLAVAALTFGCAELQELIQKPSVNFQRTELTDLSLSEGTVLFHFDIVNPNPIGFGVRKITYQCNLNEKQFVKGTLEKGITLPAAGKAPLEIPVTIRYLDFFQSVQEFIKADEMDYELFGSVVVGPFDIPYRTTGEFPVPKIPNISLKTLKISRLTLAGASLILSLGLENRNDFPITPQSMNYRISLAGVPFAEGAALSVGQISGKNTTELQIPFQVDFIKLGRSAYTVLTRSSSDYRLSGEILVNVPRVGIRKIPFEKTGRLSFVK